MKMNRKLINLFFKIKKKAPEKYQGRLKLTDSNIIQNLIFIHAKTEDSHQKYLIEKFLELSNRGYQIDKMAAHQPAHLNNPRKRAFLQKMLSN